MDLYIPGGDRRISSNNMINQGFVSGIIFWPTRVTWVFAQKAAGIPQQSPSGKTHQSDV